MNSNIIIYILAFITAIAFVYSSEYSKKENNKRLNDSIQNKINNPRASKKEIKQAYKYETGLSPLYTTHKDGTSLEYKIFEILYRYKGKVLSNLYVTKAENTTSEVDIVFVHNTGIYVIEAKDIRAVKIIGDEQEDKWDCVYSRKSHRKMYNPLKQNLNHIVALKNVLRDKCPYDCYNSVVVINCKNVLSQYSSNFGNYYQSIITPQYVRHHIDTLISEKENIFSDEEVISIYKHLHYNYANVNSKIKREHKQRVEIISGSYKK